MQQKINTGERLMALEVKLAEHSKQNDRDFSEVKDGIKTIVKKLDGFDDRYAHKDRLDSLALRVETHIEAQSIKAEDSLSWIKRNAFNIILGLGMFVIGVLTVIN